MPETPQDPDQRNVTIEGEPAEAHTTAPTPQVIIDDALEHAKEGSRDYINRVWTRNRACPICGADDWGVSETSLISLRSGVEPGSGPDPEIAFPVVPVNCHTCGYTFFINEKWVRAGGTPPELTEARRIAAEAREQQ